MQVRTIENVYLCYWNRLKNADKPTVNAVKSALIQNGFSADFAEPIPRPVALTRVVSEMTGKQKDGDTIKLVTHGDGSGKIWELRRVSKDGDSGRLRMEYVASWTLLDDGDVFAFDNSPNISTAVSNTEQMYEWGDVTKIIHAIIDKHGTGAYMLKENGGVYCIPTIGCEDLLQRLDKALQDVGIDMTIAPFMENDKSRERVNSAIRDGILAECESHQNALNGTGSQAGYSETTKPGVIENRIAAIDATISTVERLTELIEPSQKQALLSRLNSLRNECEVVLEKARAHKPTSSAASGNRRRIVSMS